MSDLTSNIGLVAIPIEKEWEGHWGIIVKEWKEDSSTVKNFFHFFRVMGGSICKAGESMTFSGHEIETRLPGAIQEKVEVHRVLQETGFLYSTLKPLSIKHLLYSYAEVASHYRQKMNEIAKTLGKTLANKIMLSGYNKTLKEQITRINAKCDDQEEEIVRLHSIIDLYKKGSLNPDPKKIHITDKDKKNLKIQCMEKKKVRDRKVQERQGEYFK